MLKYKTTVFVIVFLILFNFSSNSLLTNSQTELEYNHVCIDPGHGGIDPGAVYKDIYEKDINLNIALELGKQLEESNFIVTYTRTTDTDLAPENYKERKKTDLTYRSRILNSSSCFMFISIHLNSSETTSYRGPMMFYDDINSENEIIANIMTDTFKKYLSLTRTSKELEDLYMFKLTTKPGILAELGFLSNANDRYLLTDEEYQLKLVSILKEGIIEYQTYSLDNRKE